MTKRERYLLIGFFLLPGFPLLLLTLEPNALLIWPGADLSDLVTAHLPSSVFIHNSLVEWGQVPLWNPTILGGMPTLGDPLSGLAYPALWLTYLFPDSLTFHLLLWLHLGWLGFGTSRLARSLGLASAPAWLAAAALMLSPRLWGHWGLGHVTLVFAFSWTPWLLLALERSLTAEDERRGIQWRWFALAGGLLGLITSIDPRWAPPAALVSTLYVIYRLISEQGSLGWRATVAGGLAAASAALGTMAFFAIPSLQLLDNSQRVAVDLQALSQNAMPPAALLQAVVPNPAGWPEWSASLGAGIFMLAVLGALSKPQARFWGFVALLGSILSLGPATPLWRGLTLAVPGLDLLRIPGRWFLLVSLAGPLMAGVGLQTLTDRSPRQRRRTNLAVVAVCALVIALAGLRLVALGSFSSTAGQAAAASILIAVLLAATVIVKPAHPPLMVTIGGILVLELLSLGFFGLEARSIEQRIPPVIASELMTDYGGGRVFSPSFSYTQLEAANRQLEMVEGVHPLQLRAYRNYLAGALGFKGRSYSVTLPPLPKDGLPAEPYLAISLPLLEMLNTTHILADYPLDMKGLTQLGQEGGIWLYTVDRPRPRAWVEPVSLGQQDDWQPATIDRWSPNRIEVTAKGPGRLVLSEVHFPIWQATVDNIPVAIDQEEGLFRTIPLAAGEHHVVFAASMGSSWFGFFLTAISWLVIGALWWKR